MQHYVNVGTSVTGVNDAVMADLQLGLQFFQHGHLAITGGNADNGLDLSGILIVKEARAKNMIGRHDSFERRLDHFLRRGRYDVKRKAMTLDQVFDKTRE